MDRDAPAGASVPEVRLRWSHGASARADQETRSLPPAVRVTNVPPSTGRAATVRFRPLLTAPGADDLGRDVRMQGPVGETAVPVGAGVARVLVVAVRIVFGPGLLVHLRRGDRGAVVALAGQRCAR
ncbi:hypothetical protein NKH18_22940 [Streptomyces sp. M10(2022)]